MTFPEAWQAAKASMPKDEFRFLMEPLVRAWVAVDHDRMPSSFNEMAVNVGCASIQQYMTYRNRDWILHKLSDAIASGESSRRDNACGQSSLF